MKQISKLITASAAALFTSAAFVMTAPTVHANEYCITNGAQAAHGCGYPSMEACRAASAGIGGICGERIETPNNALAYQPKPIHSRNALHPAKKPTGF